MHNICTSDIKKRMHKHIPKIFYMHNIRTSDIKKRMHKHIPKIAKGLRDKCG